MNQTEAINSLITASSTTPLSTLETALSTLTSSVPSHAPSNHMLPALTETLINKIPPLLSSHAPSLTNSLFNHLSTVLLHLPPTLTFPKLISSLKPATRHSEFHAQTLLLFINPSLGAISRLSLLLSSPTLPQFISPLLHLPSHIQNILQSLPHDPSLYFSTLAEAIYLQPSTNDPTCDQPLSQLIRRLIRLRHTNVLISTWLSKPRTNQIIATLLRTPNSVIPDVVRAILNFDPPSTTTSNSVNLILAELIQKSPAAREACINSIPFQRPLLRRPKYSVPMLVRAIWKAVDGAYVRRALQFAAEQWSEEEFAKQADIQLQRQITRLVLCYLRVAKQMSDKEASDGDESVMLLLIEGVHHRLGDNDVRIRRHGMVVGEASSRYCAEEIPLTFERDDVTELRDEQKRAIGDEEFEDGGDSDLSEVGEKVTVEMSDDDESRNGGEQVADNGDKMRDRWTRRGETGSVGSEEGKGGTDSMKGVSQRRRKMDERWEELWGRGTATQAKWAAEDDWSSVGSYESSCDEQEEGGSGWDSRDHVKDVELVRRQIAAPMSIPRLLGLFQDVKSSAGGGLKVDAETCIAALRMAGKRAEEGFGKRGGGGWREWAGEMLIEIMGIDVERYPDEYVASMRDLRESAMVRLVEMEVDECGMMLVRNVICGKGSDVGRRSEGLRILAGGVRGAKERGVELERARRMAGGKGEEQVERVGMVTRRLGRRRRTSGGDGIRVGWIGCSDEGLGRIFRELAWGLCEGGGAEFVDLGGKDSHLWGQGIVTLSVIGGVAGVSREGCELRGEVVRLVMDRVLKESGDVVVRRACALALGGVVEKMGDAEIREMFGGNGEIRVRDEVGIGGGGGGMVDRGVEWLRKASEGDADIGVRRLAARGLQIWAERVERVG